jgi:hypothetical protein
VQYGARITAFVIYLLHYQLLPEARLVELMADLFGVKLCAATENSCRCLMVPLDRRQSRDAGRLQPIKHSFAARA